MDTYEVIISGYGPAGQVAGNILGAAGVRTLIIDRLPDIYEIPRAIHFDDEAMRIFQSIGLDREILPKIRVGGVYRFQNARGKTLFEKKLQTERTENGHAESHFIFQPEIEQSLRRGAQRFDSLTILLSHELVSYQADASGVRAEIRNLVDGSTHLFKARYLLGCDGGRSLIRKTMGHGLRDYKHDQPWLVIDGDEVGPSRFPKDPHQICDPQRTYTLVPSRGTHRRWEIYLKPDDDLEAMNTPAKIQELIAPWADPEQVRIIRSAIYRFHALIVRRWRDGRVLLAGDAAHQMPPFLGQGMCSGVRDAQNVAWKLSWILRRGVSPKLLDTYQQEREPHVDFITRKAILAGRVIQARGLAVYFRDFLFFVLGAIPFARQRFVRSMATWPRLPAGFFLRRPGKKSRAPEGELFPQPLVRNQEQVVPLDDLLGDGFAVLGRSRLALRQVQQIDPAFWTRMDTRFIEIADSDTDSNTLGDPVSFQKVQDPEGRLGDWFAKHRANAVILRPDRRVFGIDPTADQTKALVDYLYPERRPVPG